MLKFLKQIFLFWFLLLLFAPMVWAQNFDFDFSSPPATLRIYEKTPLRGKEQQELKVIRERVQERRQEIQEWLEQKRTTFGARLTEAKKERVRFFFGRLIGRVEAATSRLERLAARIESRLDKIEEENEGIDTIPIREDLEEIKARLEQVSSAITEARDSLESILLTEDPKEAFAEVRELIKAIKEQLIEIHRLLVQLIGQIKGLRVGVGK